jgi:glyoxylase-like metal-dependent hydrolase (beta-lactamase superfamily II)
VKQQQSRRLTRRTAFQVAGVIGGGLAAGLALPRARRATAQQPTMTFPQAVASLTRLAEDVWVWTNGGYNSLIIAGEEGALVTEPSSQFNRGASTLLKAVVASLSPRPVTYVVFSHDHADHNTGGDVFADTAQFVAQELAQPKIAARNDPRSPTPTITFAEHMTLDLGDKTIELHYFGRNHSDNSLVLHYPARRLIHAVDWMENRRLPFRDHPDGYPDEWVRGLERVDAELDFDLVVPGHTPPGPKSSVLDLRDYWLALMGAVRDAQAAGLADNSPEMVAFVRERLAPQYSSWGSFEQFLPLNIEGLIRIWTTGR